MSAAPTLLGSPSAEDLGLEIGPLDMQEPTRSRNFVLSSWLESASATRTPPLTDKEWRLVYRRRMSRLLARGAVVTVAAPLDTTDLLAGWACTEMAGGETAVHYVYTVVPAFRRFGVARALLVALEREPVVFTAWTAPVGALKSAGKLPPSWRFDPYWVPKGESEI